MALYKRLCLAAFCLLVLIGAVYAAGGEQETPRDKSPKCCQELLARIERLEARVRELEARSPATTLPPPPLGKPPLYRFHQVPQIPRERSPRDLPPGTEEREFNGMKYYIIPLEKAREQE